MFKAMDFSHLQKKIEAKFGKKLVDTATKTEIDAAKTTSKRVVQKTAEGTEDFIRNKIAAKISVGKLKSREKEDERQEIYISPEKKTTNY